MRNALDFADASGSARTKGELFEAFLNAVGACGFDRVAFGAITGHESFQARHPDPIVEVNYPQDWLDHYFASGYDRVDPCVTVMPSTDQMLFWSDVKRPNPRFSRKQRQLFLESEEAGMSDGFTIPIHATGGRTFIVSLATTARGQDMARAARRLRPIAFEFFFTYMALHGWSPPDIALSDRERECLMWSARGKTSWEIGQILNVSENTVNYHFKTAMGRLGCSNRTVAVVRAVQLGLIRP